MGSNPSHRKPSPLLSGRVPWQVLWSRLGDQRRWARVTGPLGALVAYLKDYGIEAPELAYLQGGSGPRGQSPEIPQSPAVPADFVWYAGGWSRLDCPEANPDPTALLWNAAVWQGAVLRGTRSGTAVCPLCQKEASTKHVLRECLFWKDSQPEIPRHWAKWGAEFPLPCLWDRGLLPARATAMPAYPHGEASIRVSGLFAENSPQWQGVEFATDASGGPYSKDPRLRVVGWAIVALCRVDELGVFSGVLGPSSTVPQGESHALQVLLDRVPGDPLIVTGDCKPAIRQAESSVYRPVMFPSWTQDGSLARILETDRQCWHTASSTGSQTYSCMSRAAMTEPSFWWPLILAAWRRSLPRTDGLNPCPW